MKIDEILKLDDTQRVTVEIPEWKTSLVVSSMTAIERGEIEKKWNGKKASADPVGFRADVLERSLKDEAGKPLATKEQIGQLMAKNARAVERLFAAACEVAGLTDADAKEIEKN